NTVAFTLDLDALQSYVNSGESGTLTLASITTSNSHTVGVYMTSEGTIGLLNGSSTWSGGGTTTLSDLVSSGLTTLVVMTEMSSATDASGRNMPATYLYGVDAEGNVATISETTGLGYCRASSYVSSVSVNSSYVTSFSVTNATLTADSDGVGAAAVALAAVPEPATATLGLLALGALALRRRRA
ncbi:MAG: PEP-CTERM sorting domain-containing protein, partial [Akkermansia sp.]|nr:PEP-CTERM sorting domain-containing protein [Akkermansia sp.]